MNHFAGRGVKKILDADPVMLLSTYFKSPPFFFPPYKKDIQITEKL